MAIHINLSDISLFGNDAAEDESQETFNAYFYEKNELDKIVDPSRQLCILRAYRGEGKSALLRAAKLKLEKKYKRFESVLCNLTGDKIVPVISSDDPSVWLKEWKKNIFAYIAKNIGNTIGFAWTDDAMLLVEEAEQDGFKEKSLLSGIIDRISVQFQSTGVSVHPSQKHRNVNHEYILSRNMKMPIWFFIDDIDENFENTSQWKIKLSSFFIACRQIVSLIPEIRVRVGIRPNVWTILEQEFESMSKTRQYIVDLSWDLPAIRTMLSKRFEGYLSRTNQFNSIEEMHFNEKHYREEYLINLSFEENMPWGGKDERGRQKNRNASVILSTLGRYRPRWIIQLCKSAAMTAYSQKRSKINIDDISSQLKEYGEMRINDLQAEYKSICPNIVDIVQAFAEQKRLYKTDELIAIIKSRILGSLQSIIINRKTISANDAIKIAHFLYEIGFLTARRQNQDGRYEHFSFAQAPNLLNNRTNIDQGMSWEIHPVFRQTLNIQSKTAHSHYPTSRH